MPLCPRCSTRLCVRIKDVTFSRYMVVNCASGCPAWFWQYAYVLHPQVRTFYLSILRCKYSTCNPRKAESPLIWCLASTACRTTCLLAFSDGLCITLLCYIALLTHSLTPLQVRRRLRTYGFFVWHSEALLRCN
jgi:hypothetical protein